MESAETLLTELAKLDIKLSVTDGKLLCNAPKGALTPALRDSIKQYKPDLLHLLESRPPTPTSNGRALPIISREGALPLSFSQERLWLLSKLDPDNHFTGNLPFAFRIKGPLDAPALEQTLNAIIQRHEVFRVRCETVGNRPLQSAAQGIRFELPVHDLSKLPSQDKEATVAIHAERHALEPFNLSHAPLLRAELLKTAADEHIFLLATHQYVFDGWSTAILFRELSTLYTAFRAGEASPLPPPSAQYADFAHWLRHGFAGAEAARQEAYWQEKLRDAQLVTALPLDHPRQANVPNRSASVAFTLPSFLADALRKLSQQVGVTLFISLLAAFQTLLYGYTRQEKLAVGSIVSNRQLTQTETMIGSFANNILISSDFFPGVTFRRLLEQVAQTSREAYANQDLPFERLLGRLNPDLTHNPLFRVMFVLHQHQSQSGSGVGLMLSGAQVQKLPDAAVLSKYDLELVMVDRHDGLSGLFAYNAGLFERGTIERMKDNFLLVLKQVTDNLERPLAELPAFQQATAHHTNIESRLRDEYTAPRTPTETAIARIWQELLRVEQIGVHDRFTDLGGHSLLAIRLLAALQQELGLEVSPGSLREFPSIAEMAANAS